MRLLLIPLLLLGTIFAIQSPAYAGCQSNSFTFELNPSGTLPYACSGNYAPNRSIVGFSANAWSGYFIGSCTNVCGGIPHTTYFCDGQYVHMNPVQIYDPFEGFWYWVQPVYFVETLYLSATKASWC
jgi:hypothetical protein